MCGIVGGIGIEKNTIKSNLDLLYNRGPDESGIYEFTENSKSVILGMRRLSITGIESGHQPLVSEDNNLVLTYNGEIYNYKELWIELNIKRKPRSDGDVILELYKKYGKSGFNRLRGMFAISLIDLKKRTVFLIRDFFGETPLYIYEKNNKILWSSNLNIINEIISKITLNNESLFNFFRFTFIPDEKTIYNEVIYLEPGSCFEYGFDGIKINSYKLEHEVNKTNISFKDLLKQKVKNGLIGEVPIGLLLSGGVDSGLLASLVSQSIENNFKVFTISSSDKLYDEANKSVLLAKHLNLKHYIINFHKEFDKIEFIKFIKSLDEPFADSSVVLSFTAFNFIKKKFPEIKVVLTGDGGDEIWGGYNKHKILNLPSKKIFSLIFTFFSKALILLNDLVENKIINYKIFRILKAYSWKSRYSGVLSLGFDKFSLKKLLNIKVKDKFVSDADSLEDAMILDHKISLNRDLNTKTDRASMYNSIEARSPFLDIDLYSLNKSNFISKVQLIKIFNDLFPFNYFKNAKKKGFSFNVKNFIKNDFSEYSKIYLSENKLKNIPHINIDYAKKIINRHLIRKNYRDFEVFSLLVASIWFEDRNFKNQ